MIIKNIDKRTGSIKWIVWLPLVAGEKLSRYKKEAARLTVLGPALRQQFLWEIMTTTDETPHSVYYDQFDYNFYW